METTQRGRRAASGPRRYLALAAIKQGLMYPWLLRAEAFEATTASGEHRPTPAQNHSMVSLLCGLPLLQADDFSEPKLAHKL